MITRLGMFGMVFIALFLLKDGAAAALPKSWIDKDTGHRVWVISTAPYSTTAYFTVPVFSSNAEYMAYRAQDGLYLANLQTKLSERIVARTKFDGVPQIIGFGRRTGALYVTAPSTDGSAQHLMKISIPSGKIIKLSTLSSALTVYTINADETLFGALETEPGAAQNYQEVGSRLYKAREKGQIAYERYQSKNTRKVWLVPIQGSESKLLFSSSQYISHLQFSPTDPKMMMYAHEGPWQAVDRIWTINIHEKAPQLVHARVMAGEIVGHEFWDDDGQTVWYDWQFPRGEVFFVAGTNIKTRKRQVFALQRNEWSIHYARSHDGGFFVGDGADDTQVSRSKDSRYIFLYRPHIPVFSDAADSEAYWTGGVMDVSPLVNMSEHDYKFEPNVRVAPNGQLAVFRTNMFGGTAVLAVEIEKHVATDAETLVTPDLARRMRVKGKVEPLGEVM